MGALEEQAQFLVTKYGTAAGPVGVPAQLPVTTDLATLMVLVGLLIFAALLYVLARDYQATRAYRYS
jgi:hypothetical protein